MGTPLAERIRHIPLAFAASEKSTAALLQEAGFPREHGKWSIEEIEQVLRREPQLTDLWLERGQDQRLSGGWGIEKWQKKYRIQHFGHRAGLTIDDRTRACAEFVDRYVKYIEDVLGRYPT